MPRKCSVPGCRSNYETGEKYVTVFKFPSEKHLCSLWVRNILRDHWTPSDNSAVCIKHFDQSCLNEGYYYESSNGEKLFCKYDRPQLKPGSLPTIFPDEKKCPKNLMAGKRKNSTIRKQGTVEKLIRLGPELEIENVKEIELESLTDVETLREIAKLNPDRILNYSLFCEMIKEKIVELDLPEKELFCKKNQNHTIVYSIDFNSKRFRYHIEIHSNLTFKCYINNLFISLSEIQASVESDTKLTSWSHLKKILTYLSESVRAPSLSVLLEQLQEQANSIRNCIKNESQADQFNFFMEQILLLLSVRKRYSPSAIGKALSIFNESSSMYKFLKKEGILVLPDTKHLAKLSKENVISLPYEEYLGNVSLETEENSMSEKSSLVTLQSDQNQDLICIKPARITILRNKDNKLILKQGNTVIAPAVTNKNMKTLYLLDDVSCSKEPSTSFSDSAEIQGDS